MTTPASEPLCWVPSTDALTMCGEECVEVRGAQSCPALAAPCDMERTWERGPDAFANDGGES